MDGRIFDHRYDRSRRAQRFVPSRTSFALAPNIGGQGSRLDSRECPNVDDVDVAGGDEAVHRRAADAEALPGLLDGEQNLVAGAQGDVDDCSSMPVGTA